MKPSKRMRSRFRDILTWHLVRSAGELQILTRASYAMLAVVPILVGAWPSVRLLINSHNRVIEHATEQLSVAADVLVDRTTKLAETAQIVSGLSDGWEAQANASTAMRDLASEVRSLSIEVNDQLSSLRQQATLSPWLPSSWALAFLAALAATGGHLVYQGGAPNIVRRYTAIEFVRERRTAFLDHEDEEEFREALSIMRNTTFRSRVEQQKNEHPVHLIQGFNDYTETYESNIILCSDRLRSITGYYVHVAFPRRASRQGANPEEVIEYFPPGVNAFSETPEFLELPAQLWSLYQYDAARLWEVAKKQFQDQANARALGAQGLSIADATTEFEVFLSNLFAPNNWYMVKDLKKFEKTDVIADYARVIYDRSLKENQLALCLSIVLYASAFAIIVWLTFQQTLLIIQAAGWIGRT